MNIGIELECFTKSHGALARCEPYHEGDFDNDSLKVEEDGSLVVPEGLFREGYRAVEIITKPFSVSQKAEVMRSIWDLLGSSIAVNQTCGLHVNFSNKHIPNEVTPTFLRRLRGRIHKEHPQIKKRYSRHYSRIGGVSYNLYKFMSLFNNKYSEFYIKDNRVEWRSIHAQHLSRYRDDKLIDRLERLISDVLDIINTTSNEYFSKRRTTTLSTTLSTNIGRFTKHKRVLEQSIRVDNNDSNLEEVVSIDNARRFDSVVSVNNYSQYHNYYV